MALYGYACENCGHGWEKVNGLEREVCPACRYVCDRPVQLPAKTRPGKYGKAGGLKNAGI